MIVFSFSNMSKKVKKISNFTKKVKKTKNLKNLGKNYFFWLAFVLTIFLVILVIANFDILFLNNSVFNKKNRTSSVQVVDNFASYKKNYFGDIFSSDVHINPIETNFYFDEEMAAYTFKPVYEFQELDSVISDDKSNNESNCLESGCLAIKNNNLYFDNVLLELPLQLDEFKNEGRLLNFSIFALESKWLISAVVGSSRDEYGLVYYFDGQKFENLISLASQEKIKPKYNSTGGSISFGGTESNFIIIYSGRDGIAYQVINSDGQEKIINISSFFGLRITGSGFKSQIVYLGEGNERTWFVCGQDNSSIKFIKLWQNNQDNIAGALSLGKAFKNSFTEAVDYSCVSDPVNNVVNLKFYLPSSKETRTWKFLDSGFDNSCDYKINSNNLNTTGKPVRGVVIYDLVFNGLYNLFVSNNNQNWQGISKNNRVKFTSYGMELYWRLESPRSENKNYSAFFDSLTSLTYYLDN